MLLPEAVITSVIWPCLVKKDFVLYGSIVCISRISSHEKDICNINHKNQIDLAKPHHMLDNKISRMHILCLDSQLNL